MTQISRRSRPRQRGMALIEFALVLPVVLFILMGIIEMGWLVKNQLALANSVRDGARYAALGNTSTNVIARIKNGAAQLNPSVQSSQIMLLQTADTTGSNPTYSNWPSDSGTKNGVLVGNLVRIRVVYPHKTLTGFFPFLNNRSLDVSVTMLREAN